MSFAIGESLESPQHYFADDTYATEQPNPASCLRRKFRDKSATDKILRGMKRKETRTCCW